MTDWNALLGLSEYTVTIAGWPRPIPVAASDENSAVAKARTLCAASTRNNEWLTADASVVSAESPVQMAARLERETGVSVDGVPLTDAEMEELHGA